ncbi:unnamed protein product [Darwinula stevensoni]|uniref:Beta-glucosidase n=1 Tax=Darwinula stevensoni TaxID=69355 RepID=A0A7R8X8G4_9CRUS|nr:unnamed protein product [Darwinula stevensoni]CAG0888726.1 unnamed protein product [Darwinula stevensoni]
MGCLTLTPAFFHRPSAHRSSTVREFPPTDPETGCGSLRRMANEVSSTVGEEGKRRFPPDFLWGVATASYQIEGAWDRDGKGENIWDEFVHRKPSPITNGDTGDVACRSYDFYERDVDLLKALGAREETLFHCFPTVAAANDLVKAYRFSISWSRVLPDGTPNSANPLGVRYYNKLIDLLLAKNIQPMVTLYHWDLPQALEEKGGWLRPDSPAWFEEYAKFCFEKFGDRVKLWITLNEPYVVALSGFEEGDHAPGVKGHGTAVYTAAHHLLVAHARAWRAYDQQFRHLQKGKVGITLNVANFKPATSSPEDAEAANIAFRFDLGWFANPIFSEEGDYPEVMKERIEANSEAQGLNASRLPSMDPDTLNLIKGTGDFLGINTYDTLLANGGAINASDTPSFSNDRGVRFTRNPDWPSNAMGWQLYPKAMEEILRWVRNEYNNPTIYVTETGYADPDVILEDTNRIRFYCVSFSMQTNLFQQSLTWEIRSRNTSKKFGLYAVDFGDPERKRTEKMSANFYRKVIKENAI